MRVTRVVEGASRDGEIEGSARCGPVLAPQLHLGEPNEKCARQREVGATLARAVPRRVPAASDDGELAHLDSSG
jgi:hypothetical protein